MSQNDFNIANQGFPSFRSDLNSALQALASNSSGDTAPSPTYANQLWVDTTNDQLKIRNEDNDAWIVLADLDQVGDKSAPPDASITFAKLAAAAVVTEAEGIASNDNDTTIPTSAAVKALVDAATSGAAAGGIGTYVFATSVAKVDEVFGGTVLGSNLRPSSALQSMSSAPSGQLLFTEGAALSGTWRCMGVYDATNGVYEGATLWLRIS